MQMDLTTIIIGIISFLLLIPIDIVMLVQWFKFFRRIKIYALHGIGCGLFMVLLSIISLAIVYSHLQAAGWIFFISAMVVNFAKIAGFTMLGMHYCATLGLPGFPLLDKWLKPAQPADGESLLAMPDNEPGNGLPVESARSGPEDYVTPDISYTINPKRYFIILFSFVAAASIYTIALFLITTPEIKDISGAFNFMLVEGYRPPLIVTILSAWAMAFGEEIIFRLGVQNFLAKYLGLRNNKYWIAIVITAALWSLGHWGMLEPGWVKMAQVFPMGLALGWLLKKYGIEICIIVHLLFNTIMVLLNPYLFAG